MSQEEKQAGSELSDGLGGWEYHQLLATIQSCRTGWWGVWDALVAAIKRQPRLTVTQTMSFGIYINTNDKKARAEVMGAKIESYTITKQPTGTPYIPTQGAM